MIFVNEMKRLECRKKEVLLPMISVIAPFAPFIAEELWHKMKNTTSVHHQPFPQYGNSFIEESTIEYPICINGKKRGSEVFSKNLSESELQKKILELDYVEKWLEGKAIQKIIVVPNRMINIVVK
jgi:leucyl-tRNA synthetase